MSHLFRSRLALLITQRARTVRSKAHMFAGTALMVAVLIGVPTIAQAATYYVDAQNGSDTNSGTSTSTAWKSLAKVNSTNLVAGDTVLFNRGQKFYGSVSVKRTGTASAPITFGAYGSGNKPILSGFTTVSGWTSTGNGIWKTSVPTAGVASELNLVTLNGVPQAVGRFPNISAGNNGYLNYESYVGTTQITDNQLTSATNWTGAEIAVRKQDWTIDKGIVTSHVGGTVIHNSTGTEKPNNGYGFFFQRDLRTLDQLGEWYFNKNTKEFYMYFGSANPNSYTVEVSTLDRIIDLETTRSLKYITIENLAFEGANAKGIHSHDGGNITIRNSDFNLMGGYGIYIWNSPTVMIDGITTNLNQNGAIFIRNSFVGNITIQNSTIRNTGMLVGMGSNGPEAFKAVYASVAAFTGKNVLIKNNIVDTVGYVGIQFQGSDVVVENNIVNNFDLLKQDGGGIYTYVDGRNAVTPATSYTNRIVRNNIVSNGIGAPEGTPTSTYRATGIYLDGLTMNVTVEGNSVFNISRNGMLMNNPIGVTVRNNTIYNSLRGIVFMKWAYGNIANLDISNNIIYLKDGSGEFIRSINAALPDATTTTYFNQLRAMGTINSNYYNTGLNEVGFTQEGYLSVGGGTRIPMLSLRGWRSTLNFDTAATELPRIAPYNLLNTVGANLFANGQFNTNTAGLTIFGSNGTLAFDNTNKLDGGSARVTFTASTNSYPLMHAPIGPVSASKKYILRFSTLGTTENGVVNAYIRKTGSPQTQLTPVQVRSYGTTRVNHEFLFAAPMSESGASLVIALNDFSGTTYIDNVQFFEANAVLNDVNSMMRFEYNASATPKTISLPSRYVDAKNVSHTNSITLPAFSSAILFRPEVINDTTAPTVALTSPFAGTFQGAVLIGANASDAMGISKVDFYVNDALVSSDTTAGYSYLWNTLAVANGTYTIKAIATDTNDNTATSTTVTITVNNPDITLPTVTLSAPLTGATVRDTVSITADARDNVAVTSVEFYLGTTRIGTDTTAPYTAAWDTKTVANGTYTLRAVARDAATNSGSSTLVSVTVNNADTTNPTVRLTAPTAGSVSGTVALAADATDNVSVSKVDFYVGATLIGTDFNAPYTSSWNTSSVTNGSYSLTAVASDASNNRATSTLTTVIVNNADTTLPTVTLTAPSNGTTLRDVVTLTANASDDRGVARVEFHVGTSIVATDTSAPYTGTWTTGANGNYQVKAVAYDTSGNQATSSIATVTVNNPDTTLPTVTLTAPSAGTVSGTITLEATASDLVGVVRVEFYAGTTRLGTDTIAPYTATWNTTASPNVSFPLTAVAFDAANNKATSSIVRVTVNNTVVVPPPSAISVSINSPISGSTVSGGLTAFSATTTGSGITKVEFYKNNDTVPFAITSSSYITFFDVGTLATGTHTFKAIAYTSTTTATSPLVYLNVVNGSGTISPNPTPSGTLPLAPTAVTASAGYGKAKVSWTRPVSNGSPAITSYTVTALPGGSVVTTNSTTATVSGLTNGVPYTFSVRANTNGGPGASATSSTVTPVASFPTGSTVRTEVTTTLLVRSTPGGTRTGSVSNGILGTVLGSSAGWTQVRFPTTTGWVSSAYLFRVQ